MTHKDFNIYNTTSDHLVPGRVEWFGNGFKINDVSMRQDETGELAERNKSLFTISDYRTSRATALQINAQGKPVLMFHADGTIEIGEGYTPTEAGDQFLKYILPAFKNAIDQMKELNNGQV